MEITITQITAPETWLLRHGVMWPDQPLDYIKLPNDDKGLHYGLFLNQWLVSVVSLFIEGDEAQFRKFATNTSEHSKGYGSQLLTYLIKQARIKGIKRLWCNARLDKAVFYERFGMVKTEKTFSKGGIDYVIMERRLRSSKD